MGNFIPRLIVHDEELDKIYNPVVKEKSRRNQITPIDSTRPDALDDDQERRRTIGQLRAGAHQSTRAINHIATEVVDLPHKASHSWRQQFLLLGIMMAGSLLVPVSPLLAVPLASVNSGLAKNRRFLYGVMTSSEFLGLIPWVETCNFALPEAEIPVKSRIFSVLVALVFQKLVDAFIAEAWWYPGAEKIFPIPFSTIVSGSAALPIALAVLYSMTPKREQFTSKFKLCLRVLFGYFLSAFVVGMWAVGFQRLSVWRMGQVFWAFLYAPLRFVCKILLMSPMLTILNPKRWIILNFVPDIIFSRVLVATNPYIDSYAVFISLELTTILTLMWRYYNGVDRLAILWGSLRRWVTGESAPPQVADQLCANGRHIACQAREVFRLSQREITQMSMKLNGRVGPKTFVAWAEQEDGSDAMSTPPVLSRKARSLKIEEFDTPAITSSDDDDDSTDLPVAEGGEISVSSSFDSDTPSLASSASTAVRPIPQSISTVKKKLTVSFQEPTEGPDIESGIQRNLDPERKSKQSFDSDSNEDSDSDSDETDSFSDNEMRLPVKPRPVIDRRQVMRDQQKARAESKLTEARWQQRHLYHIEDSIGSETLAIIVRIQHMGLLAIIQSIPLGDHLNSTYIISPERQVMATIYGWTFVATSIIVIAMLSLLYREDLGGQKLTLSRVTSYIYRDHFWFLFLWLAATAAFSHATMINHFGADFSLEFKWLGCRGHGEMSWPGCV